MVMKERDEELALFLEMRRREKEKTNLLLLPLSSDDPNAPLGTNGGGSPISKIVSSVPVRKTAAENFLNSENENDKSDYDWLLTPPGTPLFPSLEMESQKSKMNQMELPNVRPTALKTRLANIQEEPASRSNVVSKNLTLSSRANSSITGDSRPSSSGGRTSSARAPSPTPTGRPTLTTSAKTSRSSTPTSRATLPSSKPAAPAVRSSTPIRSTTRSSTPTARPSVAASKPAPRSATPTSKSTVRSGTPTSTSTRRSATPTSRPTTRSATPTSRPTARSATPTSRPTVRSATPTPRPTVRSATPTRQPSVPSGAPSASSLSKSSSPTVKSSVPSRGTSPTVKSRPWKPSEMPGFSHDAPPNLRTSLPERPASASRGRPGAPSAHSPSVEAGSNGRRRQQSCSPSRIRTSNGNGRSIPFVRRANASDGDDVNPVEIGTKMVERVVNMRKLAPPKQDNHSTYTNSAAKSSSSLDSSGFGRTLSKKSLDMAMRHMDIRRSINSGSLRPLMTNIPASSMYSVRSGSTKSKTVSVSVTDSPLATSSNCSSEPSVNNNFFILDGRELEDIHDFGSEGGNSSPISQHSHHGR